MVWPTVVSALVALCAIVLSWRYLRRVGRLALEARQALAFKRSGASLADATNSVSERASALLEAVHQATSVESVNAEINECLMDVGTDLLSVSTYFAALSRATLFVGTLLSLISCIGHIRETGTPLIAYVYDALPFCVGVVSAGLVVALGRRAETAAQEARRSWNALMTGLSRSFDS